MNMTIAEALDIKPDEVISLVGGGGKTTIMFKLAQELSLRHKCIITTTTTKIFEPALSETGLLLVETDEQKLTKSLLQNSNSYRTITLAKSRLASKKLDGISPELIARLIQLESIYCIIVEADGAAHRSLKAPNATEPVIPESTSIVVAVVGTDALGHPLNEDTVFRAEIAANVLGMSLNERITPDAIARLLTHREGIIKGSPEKAKIVPFINKVDLDQNLLHAKEVADRILSLNHPQINQVILGQAQLPNPVLEVIRV